MSRKWLQFGLRWIFVPVLVVAAYGAGWSHRNRYNEAIVDVQKGTI